MFKTSKWPIQSAPSRQPRWSWPSCAGTSRTWTPSPSPTPLPSSIFRILRLDTGFIRWGNNWTLNVTILNPFQGRTETIDNTLNPQWVKKYVLDYQFEMRQLLKVTVYDSDRGAQKLEENDHTDWCARMHIVEKVPGHPDKGLRRTVDFQELNKVSARQTHHTPSPFTQASWVPQN